MCLANAHMQPSTLADLTTRDMTFEQFAAHIDPFLVISYFRMTGPVFPPHPHAGFSVATDIFPESRIGFWNRGSLGTENLIPPGALYRTVTGRGVLHEETMAHLGLAAAGFHIRINHAGADRHAAPRQDDALQ